ncbi:RHS repeat protein [Chitinophaga ginsengisegetis]|uniref:RHS repeat protein n=1 Tax=Chitinophaga ginsengisegetis TaxID=393003 RepID=UPI000DB992DB|nr:RHS repeat protein [Chitinophaga ginsengisegetis]MDR6571142.1 YD repeat-containing protein [Chitinophaga ginsengisegetis]MDR6650876.1 YD repeat-containing protein [Chitinophaga ginsengisegetis]MDR6657237.1 YD repeat-containing protein [Chitinophaga ginsengisegetis]
MIFSKKSLFSSLCLLLVISVHAQVQKEKVQNIIPSSPTAASLGKYGEIPVGNYTGIPQINIPIYEIKQGTVNCKIGLSYHGGGIKVEELASWVGLGWSLQSGGVINRSVRGLPDESQSYFDPANDPTNPSAGFLTGVADGSKDGESDMYTFSFGEFNGSFFYERSKAIRTVPLNNIKVSKIATGWQLTDIDGNSYFFESPEFTQVAKYCQSGSASTSTDIFNSSPTAWYLTLMVSADKVDSIQFEYEPFTTNYSLNPVETRHQLLWGGSGVCNSSNDLCKSVNYINGKRLKKIKFRNGYINFIANTSREDVIGDKRLDFVEIYNASGALYKKYQFNYGYFQASGSCDVVENSKRLRLDSLSEVSSTGRIPPHVFSYEYGELPCRLSLAVDEWGYYNGASSNTSLIPTYTYQISDGSYAIYPGADRNVNPTYTKAGTLNKITYPTGGASIFEYENNMVWREGEYSNTVSKSTYVILAPPQQNYVKNFTVNWPPSNLNAGLGGVIATINVDKVVDINGTTANAYFYKLDASGNVVSTLVLDQGEVTNYHLENGNYRISVQLPFPVTPGDPSLNPGFHVSFDWIEPDVNSTSHFLVGGLRIKKISDIAVNNVQINVRNYSYNDSTNHSSGAVLSGNKYIYPLTSIKKELDPITGAAYRINCEYQVRQVYTNLPLTATSGSYIGYRSVKVTETGKGYSTFEYTNPATNPDELLDFFPYASPIGHGWERGLLVKQADYPEGQTTPVHVKRNVYSSILAGQYSTALTAGYDLITEFVEETVAPKRIVYSNFSEFQFLQSSYDTLFDRTNHASYVAKKVTYGYNPVGFQVSSITNSNSKGEEIITAYKYPNDYNNTAMLGNIDILKQKNIISPVIQETVTRNGKLVGGSIKSYDANGKLLERYGFDSPVAVTMPAFNPANINPATNLFKLDEQISYDALTKRLNQIKPVNDAAVVYLWGYQAALPVAKITGSDYNTVKQLISQSILDNPASDQQLRDELNKIRTALAGKGLVTTYTYLPLRGISSETDPAGKTTYYEYDSFGLLKLIKDKDGRILKQYDYQYQKPITQ